MILVMPALTSLSRQLHRLLWVLMVAGAPALAAPAPADAPLIVNIDNPSFRKLVVAVPDFPGPAAAPDSELSKWGSEGAAELTRLLAFSGLFNPMAAAGYQEILQKGRAGTAGAQALEGVDMAAWKTVGVESLTVGDLVRDGAILTITLRTIDIRQGKVMVAKKYSKVPPAEIKLVMAKYADHILRAYTNKPGIFSSKLLFVGKQTATSSKQIYLSDFDGANAVAITSAQVPHISPNFSHDGRFVTYTSFEDGNPDLFLYEVATGKKRKLSGRKGLNSGSAWAANNKVVAFTGSVEGDADIYYIKADGTQSRPLIRGPGLDVDSAFSPDGKWLAFVSGRFGNPHIFRAELKWASDTEVRVVSDKRLTYAGWWNASPAWSPASDKIAFAGFDRDIDRFDLFMMSPDGTALERLTIRSGDNEHPSWSPNGQMLLFESSRTPDRGDVKGVRHLYVMNRDGSAQRPLNTGLFHTESPIWGPALE